MNFIDFIIFILCIAFLSTRRRLSSGYYFIAISTAFIGLLLGLWLASKLSGTSGSDVHKGVLALIFIYGLSILFYFLGSMPGNRLRIRLIDSSFSKIDKYLAIPTKIIALAIFIVLQSQILPYVPILGLQFMAQGSTLLYATDKLTPDTFIANLADNISPEQFKNLRLDYDSISPDLSTIKDADNFKPALNEYAASVVKISGKDCVAIGMGSGFIAAPNMVVTNAHVVTGSSTIYISDIHGSYPATPILINKDYDISVLYSKYITGKPIPLANKESTQGENVAAIGYPGGGNLSISSGKRIPDINMHFQNLKLPKGGALQFNASAMPGNSGGPIINEAGEVVAVVSGGSSGHTLGINVELVKPLLNKANSKITPSRAGVCDTKIKKL